MLGKQRGFTLIEIIIVVTVIGILSTMSVLGFSQFQADSRDAEREAKATVISEALEKYYEKNGEYPSCNAVTGSAETVNAEVLTGVGQDTLQAPQDSAENSIQCADLTDPSQGDFFAYVGDGSAACTDTSCLEYTIKYKDESSSSIIAIESRRRTDVKTSGDIGALGATATGFTSIDLSWQTIDNATSYTVQSATDINFTSNLAEVSATGLSQSIGDLIYNTKYYFRVQPAASSSAGNWSNTVNATTWMINAPFVTSYSNSISELTFNWTVSGTNRANSYAYEYATNSNFSSSTPGTTTSTSKTITGLAPGTTVYFRVKGTNGPHSSENSNTSYDTTQSICTPSSLGSSADSLTQISISWSCSGAITSYGIQYDDNSSFSSPSSTTDTASPKAIGGLAPGSTYYFRIRATSGSYSGPWSSTITRATQSICTPNITSTTALSSSQIQVSWSCSGSATGYYIQYDDNSSFSSPTGASTSATSSTHSGLSPGTTYWFRVRATSGSYNSAWSSTASALTNPTAPSNMSATANSTSQITASWSSVPGASSYVLTYSSDSGFAPPVYIAVSGTSQAVTGLTMGTTYWFKVQAVNSGGYSGYSSVVSEKTNISVTLSGAVNACLTTYNIRPVYRMVVYLNETSYNYSANTSVVYWRIYRQSTNSAWHTYNQYTGHSHYLKLNGSTVKSGSSRSNRFKYSYSTYAYERLYTTSTANSNAYDSGSITITHDADGRKTIAVRAYDTFGGQVPGISSCSTSYALSDLR